MNHCYVNYSTDGIKVGDYYTITSGYIASVEEKPEPIRHEVKLLPCLVRMH